MLGNLYSDGQSLEVLERAYFHSLVYWDGWHKVMAEAKPTPPPNP